MNRERRLRAVDEANLVLDRPGQVNVFLVAGLLRPGGFLSRDGRPAMDALRAAMSARIAHIPALRQVPARVGLRHEWVVREPELESHIRLLPPIAGLDGLQQLCADLMAEPLPSARPLWEMLVSPLPDGAAVILRIHHAIADGMAAAALIRQLLDADDGPVDAVAPALSSAPVSPHGGRARRLAFGIRRTFATLTGRGVAPSILLGERSTRHGVVFADADLDAIATRAHRADATVNDALLAAAAAGYRAALVASGRSVPSEVPVSVPVALRRTGDSRNQVGVMLVRLPLDAATPDKALHRIAAQTRVQKSAARQQGTLELMRGPLGARIMNHIAHRQHLVGGFVTNVPGPTQRLRLAGAPVSRLWPVAVLAANVRLGVAAVSYAGRLCLGIHFDAAYIGDAVGSAVRRELEALAS